MRQALALAAFFAISASTVIAAAASDIEAPHKLGVGIQLGYPGSGLSFNYFLSSDSSLQIDPLLYFNNHFTGVGGRIDYLLHPPSLVVAPAGDLVWYIGPGANLFSLSNANGYHGEGHGLFMGVEAAIGIGWQFAKVPIDINVEAVPTVRIIDGGGVDIGADIFADLNARYYF